MSRRQVFNSAASSFGATLRTSSPQLPRSTCIYQQTRTLKYESYEERRKAAKEWIKGPGMRYMRPRRGQTNYLGGRNERDRDTGMLANLPIEGGESVKPKDPWADEDAVDKLKDELQLSDDQIHEYRTKHQGLTPAVLSDAIQRDLSDSEIKEAIQRRADEQFDAEEASRARASKLMEQKQEQADAKVNNRPFPGNRVFKSQPVLSEELREMIYLKVMRDGHTVRTVSTLMNVSMERVGAVVRMKQMERDWVKKGKPLAVPYSRAVLDMIPTTPFVDPSERRTINPRTGRPDRQPIHESINELPVHPSTTHQTFVSVPESRLFTRADAAKAFHPTLKPADERIPHPELLELERFRLTGPSARELKEFSTGILEREKKEVEKRKEREARREEKGTSLYQGKRWDFRFEDVSVESVGKDGRSRKGVGWRYGMPHEDRKRGQIKIPTSVS